MTAQMMSQLVLPQAFFDRKPLITADGETLTLDDRFQMMELIHRFEWSAGALNIPTYGLRHLFSNHVLFIDEQGRASIVAHMLVIQVVSEQPLSVTFPAVLDQGMNRYVFRKEDGRWKICEMIFEQQKLADYIGVPESIQRSMAQTAIERARDQGR